MKTPTRFLLLCLAILTLQAAPASAQVTAGLIAHYPFDDGTATNVVGNGHNGTTNGVTWVAGKSGLAAQFDGSGSYIDLGTDSELDFDQPFTVTLWFQLHGAPFPPDVARNLLTRWDSYVGGVVRDERQFSIGIESDDRLSTAVTADGGHPAVLVDGTDVLPTSQWTFCSVSWDGSTVRLYKNGNEVGSMPQNYIAPAPHLRTAIGALLGDPTCSCASTLNGVVDEVRIYDRALSAVEVEDLHNALAEPLQGMVLVPSGSFTMGDTRGEGETDEGPLHVNHVSAFYMDTTEVTRSLWNEVSVWAVAHGYSFDSTAQAKGDTHPVVSVSWFDAAKWCNARSEKEGRVPAYYTGATLSAVFRDGQVDVQNDWVKWHTGYRLPTEAEWERAARGGATGHRFPWTDDENISHARANYNAQTEYPYNKSYPTSYHPAFRSDGMPYTNPVDFFPANAYGLYGMAGNVWEWCWDWYAAYDSASQADPRGPNGTLSERVERGGDWGGYEVAKMTRCSARGHTGPAGAFPHGGFRTVITAGATATEATVTNLAISPPDAVSEHSTNSFGCSAEFSDGTSRDVSTEAQWSVSPALSGFSVNQGQLVAGNVTGDASITVQAEYGGQRATRQVLIVAAKAELVEYYLASAQAPLTMNTGMVGAVLFPPTSCRDATSEVAGNQITYTLKTPGSLLQDIQPGSPYTWGEGERALQQQVSFLNVPVYVYDPVHGYCDCSITGRDGEGAVIDRKRAMVSKVRGSFRVKPALKDVTLEAQAYGFLDSYTLAGVREDINVVKTTFNAASTYIGHGVLRTIEKALPKYLAGKTVDIVLNPVSAYEGQLTMTLVGGGSAVEREVLYLFPLRDNYLGVWLEVGEESVSSAPFEVGDGKLVQWELDLGSYVRTRGYGRAAATFDTFEVRILHKGEVIGTVNSGNRPLALTAPAVPKEAWPQSAPKPETAAMGSALAAFNNLFFETEVNTNLVTGKVVLMTNAGPVAPTHGRAFTLIEGSNDVAGFITTINLPRDAQTLSIDTRFLVESTNWMLTNALLAVAVWDTNGIGAGMGVSPAIHQMQGFVPPYGGYTFASDWRTTSLSVTGMQGPVYLAVFLDSETVTNEVIAVALDALRVSDLPAERPRLDYQYDATEQTLELRWPTNAHRFVLRSAGATEAGYWMRVLEKAIPVEADWSVSLPALQTNRFFRLQFE